MLERNLTVEHGRILDLVRWFQVGLTLSDLIEPRSPLIVVNRTELTERILLVCEKRRNEKTLVLDVGDDCYGGVQPHRLSVVLEYAQPEGVKCDRVDSPPVSVRDLLPDAVLQFPTRLHRVRQGQDTE